VGTVAAGCIRILYRVVDAKEAGVDVPLQIGFAPGRTSSAVVRNRIRRMMREVYRVNQSVLIGLSAFTGGVLTLMVLYRGKEDSATHCIPADLVSAMRKLAERLSAESRAPDETAA
jgi:ribonuclease P protein component